MTNTKAKVRKREIPKAIRVGGTRLTMDCDPHVDPLARYAWIQFGKEIISNAEQARKVAKFLSNAAEYMEQQAEYQERKER